jgi:hypothetical protein
MKFRLKSFSRPIVPVSVLLISLCFLGCQDDEIRDINRKLEFERVKTTLYSAALKDNLLKDFTVSADGSMYLLTFETAMMFLSCNTCPCN